MTQGGGGGGDGGEVMMVWGGGGALTPRVPGYSHEMVHPVPYFVIFCPPACQFLTSHGYSPHR